MVTRLQLLGEMSGTKSGGTQKLALRCRMCQNTGTVSCCKLFYSLVTLTFLAILPGDPLCDPSQYFRIVSSFLTWLKKETRLKPIWILCSSEMEEILGERLGWKTLSCVSEERVDTSKKTAESDPEVAKKIRKAITEGVKITDIDWHVPVPEDIKERANERVKDWLANPKGTQ